MLRLFPLAAVLISSSLFFGQMGLADDSSDQAEYYGTNAPQFISEIQASPAGSFTTPATSSQDSVDTSNMTPEQEQAYNEELLQKVQGEIANTLNLLSGGDQMPEDFAGLPDGIKSAIGARLAVQAQSRSTQMSGLTCLAVAIQGEAGGEPLAGKKAVAETIMDRAHGNSGQICSVVYARNQFEAMSHRAKSPTADTLGVARQAIASGEGKTCGWDYFINASLQTSIDHRQMPDWYYDFEKRGCKHETIGTQIYFSSCSCKVGG